MAKFGSLLVHKAWKSFMGERVEPAMREFRRKRTKERGIRNLGCRGGRGFKGGEGKG